MEEISSEIFSIITLKIKRILYELTPFKVFCHCFFFFFFFFAAAAADETNLLILVQFAAEFFLTITMLQNE